MNDRFVQYYTRNVPDCTFRVRRYKNDLLSSMLNATETKFLHSFGNPLVNNRVLETRTNMSRTFIKFLKLYSYYQGVNANIITSLSK